MATETALPVRSAATTEVRRRVAVLDLGFIPIYWARYWQILNRIGSYDYVVFHGDPPADSGWVAAPGPHEFPNRRIVNRDVKLPGWRAIYQPVLREIMTGGYDAVILGHEIKFISNLMLLPLCKLRGIKVIYWGFGYHADIGLDMRADTAPLIKRLATGFKDGMAKLADGYLAYTARGRTRMIEQVGLDPERVFVVRQTIDVESQIALHAEMMTQDRAAVRRGLGLDPDACVFLFIGRMLAYKRVDQLIEAVRTITDAKRTRTPVQALVIGGGRLDAELRAQAEGSPNIRFEGSIADQAVVARYMRAVDAVVIPGVTGITVTHAFAHGLPLITRAGTMHSPEAEYIEDGRNGLMVEGDMQAFTDALARFADDPDLRARLAAGALATRDGLSLTHMAEQFDRCARAVLGDTAVRA
ncbi:glycosyltransferase family 4 protein [Marinivivus vitaminiproducens]|uniref:glycosyltransferase family 4 protein n=1 Tax=Marinivivus vitaminiproducens TaxID=3035935 RepID=UPI0027A3361E|nr:glycosyltransferase family 4 protein [Geminicoccaceae bacterium SCSIO 64248]